MPPKAPQDVLLRPGVLPSTPTELHSCSSTFPQGSNPLPIVLTLPTVKLVDPVIQSVDREGGVQLVQALGGNTIAHFAKGLSLWTREDALRMDVWEQTEKKFAFNVTRCRYAEM